MRRMVSGVEETLDDLTDADLVVFLRDPTTSSGLLPQWVRDSLATRFENAAECQERLRRMCGMDGGRWIYDLTLDQPTTSGS